MKLRKFFRKLASWIQSSKTTSKLNKEFYKSSSNSIDSHGNESLVHQTVENVELQYQILKFDCLVYIFERNMSILEMIKLRTVCRSWNAVVCEVLRKKNTLKVFPGRGLLSDMYRLPILYDQQKSHPVLRISEQPEHENIVFLGVCNHRNVFSFVSFLYNRMPNITKLVLVLEVDYRFCWSWFESILDAVPNMENFFLSLVDEYDRDNPKSIQVPVGRHTTSIERYQALKVMHRSFQKRTNRLRELFLGQNHFLFPSNNIDDLLEVTPRLELLSIKNLPMNIKQKPLIRELSLSQWPTPYRHIFPNLETLRVIVGNPNSVIDDIGTQLMPNLKHLEFGQSYLRLYSARYMMNTMSRLNSLRKLEHLTCGGISILPPIASSLNNRTITRLDLTQPIHDVSNFLEKSLPTILGVFVGVKQLTIHHFPSVENNLAAKDARYKELMQSVPKGITVKFIEEIICLEKFRYMGRFRKILNEQFIENYYNNPIKYVCGCGRPAITECFDCSKNDGD